MTLETGKNTPKLEITEVIKSDCIILTTIINTIQGF